MANKSDNRLFPNYTAGLNLSTSTWPNGPARDSEFELAPCSVDARYAVPIPYENGNSSISAASYAFSAIDTTFAQDYPSREIFSPLPSAPPSGFLPPPHYPWYEPRESSWPLRPDSVSREYGETPARQLFYGDQLPPSRYSAPCMIPSGMQRSLEQSVDALYDDRAGPDQNRSEKATFVGSPDR